MLYDAIPFDLDGTLIDTAPDFVVVVNEHRQQNQLSHLDPETISRHVSDGSRALTRLSFNEDDPEVSFEKKRQEFLDIYLRYAGQRAQLYEGISTLVSAIRKDCAWGIVTNKPRPYTEKLLSTMNLETWADVVVCPDDVGIAKPDPTPLLHAAKLLDVASENCLYIGDHARDIEAGKKAGMQTIAVSYGYVSDPKEAYTWEADIVVDLPLQILDHLAHNK